MTPGSAVSHLNGFPVTTFNKFRVSAVRLEAGTAYQLGTVATRNLELLHVVDMAAVCARRVVAGEVLVLVELEGTLAGLVALILLGVDAVLDDTVTESATVLQIKGVLGIVAVAACGSLSVVS
jgi:hypothetical protein